MQEIKKEQDILMIEELKQENINKNIELLKKTVSLQKKCEEILKKVKGE